MNVASKELCSKLYELSGWDDTSFWYSQLNETGLYELDYTSDEIIISVEYLPGAPYGKSSIKEYTPAYDLDYLLDKMVERKTGLTLYHVHSTMQWECFYSGKFFEYGTETQHWETQDSNPADAACMLALELFKQGVLKHD